MWPHFESEGFWNSEVAYCAATTVLGYEQKPYSVWFTWHAKAIRYIIAFSRFQDSSAVV